MKLGILKLEDFRLASYDERSVLQLALQRLRALDQDHYPNDVANLLGRLARTQCQPGGCEYCNEEESPWTEPQVEEILPELL